MYKTGLMTATTITDTATLLKLRGKIVSIEVTCSASTDFKMYTLQDDDATLKEYILGTGAAAVTVGSHSVFHSVATRCEGDGVDLATAANIYENFVAVDEDIKIDASSLTATDTWSVNIITVE